MLALVRTFLIVIWLILCTFWGGIFSLLRFRHPSNVKVVARVFGLVGCRLAGIQLIRRNFETMESKIPFVVVANHQHNLDVLVHGSMVPSRTVSIGKKEILWIPFFGLIYYLTGNILINRRNLDQAKETLEAARLDMFKRNLGVWIFPEGTRRFSRELGPFKKGAFHLAIAAQVPLYPVVASSFKGAVDLNRWNAGTVIVETLPPIPTEGLDTTDVDDVLDRTHRAMSQALDRLNREVEQSQNRLGSPSYRS